MKNKDLQTTYKLDYFGWLVELRLKNFSRGLPINGTQQQCNGYDNISFNNEQEYIDLIIQTEKQFPDFSFYDEIFALIDIPDLNNFHEKIQKVYYYVLSE